GSIISYNTLVVVLTCFSWTNLYRFAIDCSVVVVGLRHRVTYLQEHLQVEKWMFSSRP
ncbi:unnamed protein product, partial [Linum tenue]